MSTAAELVSDARKRVMFWLNDGPVTGWVWDRAPDWIGNAVGWMVDEVVGPALCLVCGHAPTCDHCGRPEHDYCMWCRKPTPGEAHR